MPLMTDPPEPITAPILSTGTFIFSILGAFSFNSGLGSEIKSVI